MDIPSFLDAFEHIVNAPGGIAQLRSMIYQLAVTGALTPRLEQGLSSRDLLRQVDRTRLSLIKAKRYKRMLELEADPVMPPQGIEIPESWEWSRLLDLGEINPRNTADDDDRVAYLPMRGVPVAHRGTVEIEQGKWVDLKKGYTHFSVGDVVLAKITPCFENGKAAVIPPFHDDLSIGGGSTELLVFRPIHPAINTAYVYLFLRSPMFAVDGQVRMTGTAGQKRLPTEYFATRAIPLPPIDEQAQIVAKVDELMAFCDRLENQHEERREYQVKMRKALIQAVASASASGEVFSGWSKVTKNFAQLFSSPEDVEDLRGLILDLAVRGELVPQSDGDETAIAWFDRLGEKGGASTGKRQAFATGLVKESPYREPKGWAFFHLGAITDKIGSGSTPRGGRAVYVKEGVPFLRSQNVWNDGLRLHDVVCVLPEVHERMAGSAVRSKDILLNITGASLGRCALVPDQIVQMNVSQHVTIIRPKDDRIRQYLHLCMLSPHVQSMVWGRQVGMAREGLSKKVLEQFEIPIPPLPEQDRIVTRVAELMALCVILEDQLRDSKETAQCLAESAVSKITGVAITEEEAELKAPETELIAPLRIGTPPNGSEQAPLSSILVRHSGALSAKDLWQRFGGEIDGFYAQLTHEVAQGWIVEPEVAEMRERESA